MTSGPSLESLQHWMRAVVTHPDGVAAGTCSDEARSRISVAPEALGEVLTRSRSLSAARRLAIYHHGYFRRLLDCLANMMPVLRHALGRELFEQFAFDYLARTPSRSYTLNRLDDRFVRYLRETRPGSDLTEEDREAWPDFIIDLATLEHEIQAVFDGEGAEDQVLLSRSDVEDLSWEHLARTRFVPVACLRLRQFRFPVRRYLLAVRSGEEPPLPVAAATCLALNRRNYRVRLVELSRPQHALLAALRGGHDLARALTDVDLAGAGRVTPDDARTWLARFAQVGFFLRVETEIPGFPGGGV